ncbi:MAG: hypothetical protein EOM20_20760, partial [Spartobacteria bacterium]|nr:hypothetical protein [Spartobacteria bacterium]
MVPKKIALTDSTFFRGVFDVDDPSGATFELDVCGFSSSASGSGSDAEVVLNVTGDIHTNRAYDADNSAIIARLQYNNNASQVKLLLYTKDAEGGTWGSNLYDSGWTNFTTNRTLHVAVNSTSVTLTYPGVFSGSIAHGLDLSQW